MKNQLCAKDLRADRGLRMAITGLKSLGGELILVYDWRSKPISAIHSQPGRSWPLRNMVRHEISGEVNGQKVDLPHEQKERIIRELVSFVRKNTSSHQRHRMDRLGWHIRYFNPEGVHLWLVVRNLVPDGRIDSNLLFTVYDIYDRYRYKAIIKALFGPSKPR